MTAPAVEVIIPHANGVEILRQCLHSLSRATWLQLRITVVDNASSDESVAMLRAEFPAVNILALSENRGFAGGCNAGIRASTAPYLLLLNNDTEVEPGFIEPLVELLERNRQAAAVQPRLCSLPNPGYLDYAGAAGGMLDRYGFPFAVGRLFDSLEPDAGQYRHPRLVFWASGTAVLLRAAALAETGLLDERFFMHMEEIDLAWRLHLHGWQVWVVPQVAVFHHSGYSLPPTQRLKVYLNFRNSVLMLCKNYGAARLWRRLPLRLLQDWVAMLQAIVKGEFARFWGIKLAYLWLLSHPRLIARMRREVQQQRRLPDSAIERVLYPGSIVDAYFLRGVRRFSELGWDIAPPPARPGTAASTGKTGS